jgi:hypothetical protein
MRKEWYNHYDRYFALQYAFFDLTKAANLRMELRNLRLQGVPR